MPGRRAARVLAAIGVGASLLGAGCRGDAGPGEVGTVSPGTGARLLLEVEPRTGDAPLEVRLTARLAGDTAVIAGCPSLAWTFGTGEVLFAEAEGCAPGRLPAEFTATHTYTGAGAFEASVRFLASPVEPSGVVQLLVLGPTPTPASVAALPGPTIVIATPAAAGTAAVPTEPIPGPTATAGPVGTVAGAGAGPTTVVAAVQVLPSDLCYLDRESGLLWRMPGSGAGPAIVPGVPAGIRSYAISTMGHLAYVYDGALHVMHRGAARDRLVAARGSAPVWSADGRRLAFASDGVWAHDVDTLETRRLRPSGTPLAWSADGAALVVRGADGAPELVDGATGDAMRFAVPPVAIAGWLPGRPVAWLAGAGLQLLTTGDPPMLGQVLAGDVVVAVVGSRPDGRLVALADRGDGMRAYEVDLDAAVPAAVPAGPRLALPEGTGFAWAPDGRTVALANVDGLSLLDTATGAVVRLVRQPVGEVEWLPIPR